MSVHAYKSLFLYFCIGRVKRPQQCKTLLGCSSHEKRSYEKEIRNMTKKAAWEIVA